MTVRQALQDFDADKFLKVCIISDTKEPLIEINKVEMKNFNMEYSQSFGETLLTKSVIEIKSNAKTLRITIEKD